MTSHHQSQNAGDSQRTLQASSQVIEIAVE
jgi:hypothetical protein